MRDSEVRRWIEHEMFGERVSVDFVDAVPDILTSLTLVPPPWPQLLIIDLDAIARAEVDQLATIREAGWPGMVIALGDPGVTVQRSLDIDIVVPRSLKCEQLRNALKELRSNRAALSAHHRRAG
ncbi:MAG TPA: hypothetical protein VFV99_23860 [Kofleriaceae bacterium]|nr:hypothetical protein [Kofleriaceae bacterium]